MCRSILLLAHQAVHPNIILTNTIYAILVFLHAIYVHRPQIVHLASVGITSTQPPKFAIQSVQLIQFCKSQRRIAGSVHPPVLNVWVPLPIAYHVFKDIFLTNLWMFVTWPAICPTLLLTGLAVDALFHAQLALLLSLTAAQAAKVGTYCLGPHATHCAQMVATKQTALHALLAHQVV